MTDTITDRPGFEGRLTSLLQERAGTIEVHPDLEAIAVSPAAADPQQNRPGARSWWLATAAALLIAAAVGSSWSAAEPTGTTTDAAASAARAETDQTTLIIWMEPSATPAQIEAVAADLAASEAVIEVSYLGADGTWQRFVDHFADQPGIVDLVEADALPTSFRVVTDEPGDVGELVTGLAGVDGVENVD